MVNSLLLTRITCTFNRCFDGIAALLLMLEEPVSTSSCSSYTSFTNYEYSMQTRIRTSAILPLSTKRRLSRSPERHDQHAPSRRIRPHQSRHVKKPSSPSSPVSIIHSHMPSHFSLSAPSTTLSSTTTSDRNTQRKRPRSPSTPHLSQSNQQSQLVKTRSRRLSFNRHPSSNPSTPGKRCLRERPSNVRQQLKKDIRAARRVNFATVVEYIP